MPKPVGVLQVGFFTFTIDELDRLRGQFGHEHEYARDVWRLRRLGVTGVPRGWRLDFREIEQGWLRTAVKAFLRWRHDTGHRPSRIELAHQRIKELTEENPQLRTQLAIAHGQRRASQITASRTPSTTQTH